MQLTLDRLTIVIHDYNLACQRKPKVFKDCPDCRRIAKQVIYIIAFGFKALLETD